MVSNSQSVSRDEVPFPLSLDLNSGLAHESLDQQCVEMFLKALKLLGQASTQGRCKFTQQVAIYIFVWLPSFGNCNIFFYEW